MSIKNVLREQFLLSLGPKKKPLDSTQLKNNILSKLQEKISTKHNTLDDHKDKHTNQVHRDQHDNVHHDWIEKSNRIFASKPKVK